MRLTIDRVSKQYKNKIAVDRVSLKLEKGVYGLLGENGAGKTTLIRMICGVARPDSGTISLDGIDVSQEAYRAMLGYLPQEFGYYPDFSGEEFLLYIGALKGMPKAEARRSARELLELVGLKDAGRSKIRTFSGGMKQRLGIAQALLNRPGLLVLDEPSKGLDLRERAHFRKLVGELGRDAIVILSTHIVSDVEHMADEILIMREGRLDYRGKWQEGQGNLEAFCLERFQEDKADE